MDLAELAFVGKVVAQQNAEISRALEVEDHMFHCCVGRHRRSGHLLAEVSDRVL